MFQVLEPCAPGAAPPDKLPKITEKMLLIREEKAKRKAADARSRLGVGVTQEAQEVFDNLSKT